MVVVRSIVLIAVAAFGACAADLSGNWKVVYTGPESQWPKTASEMTFHLVVDGDHLTGTADMGGFPGKGPVTDGRVEGDRFTFTVVTPNRWWVSGPPQMASGYPKLIFSGVIENGQMKMRVVMDSVMIYGSPTVPKEFEMLGTRVTLH
jgi:hypothetical protein